MVVVEDGRLSSAETARRLGIKIETLYAYVSRGLLRSERVPGGRGSTFAIADIDSLARSGARPRARDSEPFRFPAISTASTLVANGQLYYRGESAVLLSTRNSFEDVADLLWGGSDDPRWSVPVATGAAVRRSVRALPAAADLASGLRVALAAGAAVDPLRHDLRPAAVRRTARLAVAGMVEGLGAGGAGRPAAAGRGRPRPVADVGGVRPVAERLVAALASPGSPSPDAPLVGCVQAALVLLADHGLAASTVAARVAASARADPYAVIGAGLGALDSPLHGAASAAARTLLVEVDAGGDAGAAVFTRLRSGHAIPGIGHPLYPLGDPRGEALLARCAALPGAGRWLAATRAVEQALGDRDRDRDRDPRPGGERANVDMALAVLTLAGQLPADAGEAIFGVARAAGWIAHALEEYREEPLRWRGRDHYTGRQPSEEAAVGSAGRRHPRAADRS